MSKARKTMIVCFLAGLMLALTVAPAVSYFLLGASVDPTSAYPGDTVNIKYTVGDPMVNYGVSQGPYRVEIYYCNAPDPNQCFVCGKASLDYPTIYCLGDWDYYWSARYTHFNCQGAVKGLIGTASHDGALLGTTFNMPWTIPTDLQAGKYNIHILVGYEGECDNGTHYTLPIDILCRPNPAIHIDKTGPYEAYEGDTIRYEYKVTNAGNCDLQNVTVDDNVAGPANYVSGDINTNGWLDLNETWCFEKQYTIPVGCPNPLVNTATATGYDKYGTIVTDQARWSVEILCKPNPQIDIDKTGPSEAYEGDTITYYYDVTTDQGNVPLHNVTVVDDKAGQATYVSGDTNNNGWLDLTETWRFKANYTVPVCQHDYNNDCNNDDCDCPCHDEDDDCDREDCYKHYNSSCSKCYCEEHDDDHCDDDCDCPCHDECSLCCPSTLVNTATATGYDSLGTKVTATDTHSVRILCKPKPPTSQITDTDCHDLTTMIFKCKSGKVSSTAPGGVLYWVRWNTGTYSGPVTIKVNPVAPDNEFVLWSTNPVQVQVNGVTVYTGNNTTWTGNVSANSKIVMRVHYKSSLIGKDCSLVNPSYIFSALVNGMYTEDVLLTSCVKKCVKK
jgi:uncharacterized repeat protein (TIGR01451 family)